MSKALTQKQLADFLRLYEFNEMDIIKCTMTDEEKLNLFNTTDLEEIRAIVMDGVKHIKTQKDIEDGFGLEYEDVYR